MAISETDLWKELMVCSHIFHSSLFISNLSCFWFEWSKLLFHYLEATALLSSLNPYFLYLSTMCFLSDKRLSLWFPHPSLFLTAFTRRESTFSANTTTITSGNSPVWTDLVSLLCSIKTKKCSSHSQVSFKMSSLLRLPPGFRAYQEISACKVVVYMKSSGDFFCRTSFWIML